MGWAVRIILFAFKQAAEMLEVRKNRNFIFDPIQDIGLSRHFRASFRDFLPKRVVSVKLSSSKITRVSEGQLIYIPYNLALLHTRDLLHEFTCHHLAADRYGVPHGVYPLNCIHPKLSMSDSVIEVLVIFPSP